MGLLGRSWKWPGVPEVVVSSQQGFQSSAGCFQDDKGQSHVHGWRALWWVWGESRTVVESCVCVNFSLKSTLEIWEKEKNSPYFCLIPPDFWSDFSYSFAVFSSLSHSTCFSPLKYSSGVFPAWGYFSLLDWIIFWFLFKFKGNHQWDGSFETTWDRTDFKSFLISFFFFFFCLFKI